MKNLILLFVLISFTAFSCGNSSDQNISYEVNGEKVEWLEGDVTYTNFFEVYSISATDASITSQVTNNEITFTWIGEPEVKTYTGNDPEISTSFFYEGSTPLEGPKDLVVDITENSEEFIKGTFSMNYFNFLELQFEITNGVIDVKK